MATQGTVKFFNANKGFGFILQENGGPDIFVHANDCNGNPPQEGDQLSFDVEFDDRKQKERAVNVSGGTGQPGGGKGFGGGGKGFGGGGYGGGFNSGGYGGGGFGGGFDQGYGGGYGGGKGW